MNRIWIKLYLEILDDPKMGRLPDHLWRRSIELFLFAGRNGNDGALPTVEELAWGLRSSVEEVTECLTSLSQVGIVRLGDAGQWVVSSFEKRQYSESYERMKRYRERNKERNSYGEIDGDDTLSSSSSSSSTSYSSSNSLEGGGTGEETNWIPETPKEAASHPYIRIYQQITKRFPSEQDYGLIIETMQYLHEKHASDLTEYLFPFWTAWSTRKTKDRKPYSTKSLVWLCEWAMQESVPSANGHEPQSGETKSASNMAVIQKVAQHAKR
jgi:hypothetical protein